MLQVIPTGALNGKCDSCGEPQCLSETCHLWECFVSTGTCCCSAWPLKGQLANHESNRSGVYCSCCLCSWQASAGEKELCCFRFSEGWLPGRGVGEQGDHREIISSHEVLFLPSGKVSLKADHITLKIAEQWEMPSHGPDVLFAKENYWYETW